MKLLCESGGHSDGNLGGQHSSKAPQSAKGARERKPHGPRLTLEINSFSPQVQVLGKSVELLHGSVSL